MKIGLIDEDSHNFPNLVLMKLAAYHKARGDQVEKWNGLVHYDRVYQSRVFDSTYTKPFPWVEQLNRMRIKMLHFAWDNYEMQTYEKLKEIRKNLGIRSRESRVYVLTNYNTTHQQDLERVEKLKELGFDPFVMIYDKPSAPKITRQLQRWCNNKYIFYSCTWEEYRRSA